MRNKWLAASLTVFLIATVIYGVSAGVTLNLFKIFAVGIAFGLTTVFLGEVFRLRELLNLEARPRDYWRYRWMTLRTAFARATTEDYELLVHRDPEGWYPNAKSLIRRARRSGDQITDSQWTAFFCEEDQWLNDSTALHAPSPNAQAIAYEHGTLSVIRSGILPPHWYLRLASHKSESVRWFITQSPYASDEAKVTAALLSVAR